MIFNNVDFFILVTDPGIFLNIKVPITTGSWVTTERIINRTSEENREDIGTTDCNNIVENGDSEGIEPVLKDEVEVKRNVSLTRKSEKGDGENRVVDVDIPTGIRIRVVYLT